MVKKEIVIIGAGASGLMAASRYRDRDILILEANDRIARKIAISGGGRCNITNRDLSAENYLGDRAFIAPILANFDQHALLAWLHARGLDPIIRKERQYFCPKDAHQLIQLLQKACHGVPIVTGCRVGSLQREEEGFVIETTKGRYLAQKVIVAAGGMSFPKIGATPVAFEIAEAFGHTIVPLRPALVGFTLQREQFWMKALSGISLDVVVRVSGRSIRGELLFAHRGISGPAILNSSLYWQKGQIEIDFMPSRRIEDLLQSRKLLSTVTGLPRRFAKAFLDAVGVADKPASQADAKDRARLARLHACRFAPAGNFGYAKAEVTAGGISTDEIDPQTMESRLCPGLYFLGEALDVTGELGGYNFQWAFATAQRVDI